MGLAKSKVKIPVYEAPIQKRINQFYSLKNCAEELSREAIVLADQFNVFEADGKKNHNVALGLAVRLALHGTQTKTMSPQFELFLLSMSEVYDEISREQAIFQKELHDKVIDPLKSWLKVEFRRMDAEIQKLNGCMLQYNQAKAIIHKKNTNESQLLFELSRRELQLQMDVVKVELYKLATIKESHNKFLRDLIRAMASYHEKVAKLLEAKRTDV